MTDVEQIKQDLDFVSNAVRGDSAGNGIPQLYFLWAILIAIGFSLPDFAPAAAGLYWLCAGIGGGLFSWWFAERRTRRQGINNSPLGRRYGAHWLVTGIALLLCFLPLVTGRMPAAIGATNFLLVTGLAYSLAGVHLEKPMLASGIVMLGGYAVMQLLTPPYAWTLTGLITGISLAIAGIAQLRAERREAA